jgi:hypothetical protein
MSIDQRRYVDIASAVVGGAAVPMQKLDLRVFSTSDALQPSQILEFTNSADVAALFGSSSEEAKLATNYFAYVSPAPVSKANAIQFARHVIATQNPTMKSGKAGVLQDIKNLGASVEIILNADENQVTATADFSSVASFADVADELTTAFSGLDVKPTFAFIQQGAGGYFVATFPDFTLESASFEGGVFTSLVGFDDAEYDAGAQAESMVECYQRTYELSDSFGSCYFIDQRGLTEIEAVAAENATKNVKHQLYIDVAYSDVAAWSAALKETASAGLILRDGNSLAFLPAAILSATDYTRSNATKNYMYRQSGVTFAAQVTTNAKANELDLARVNYYGQTASAGAKIAFFQRAFLCGTANAPLDMGVHANEQWLKAYLTQQWFSLMLSTRGVPANFDGEAILTGILGGAVTMAINNGTILAGKTLTELQKIAVADASGSQDAWRDVQDKGYWYKAEIVEKTGASGLAEYVGNYTLVYGKGDFIRKISGSHNLV